jgi:hypothetical protein
VWAGGASMRMEFIALECECDGVSVSAKRCNESDSVVLGDSSNNSTQ